MQDSDWLLFRSGLWASEEIGKAYGIEVTKALDPLDPRDFLSICVRLAGSLKFAVKGTEGIALRNALDSLDVNWPELTEEARDKVIAAARAEVAGLGTSIPTVIEPVLSTSALSLVTRTRAASVGKFSFGHQLIDEAPVDREAIDNLPRSQMVYIKDQYGNRADTLDLIAKKVVASGLERGLGRDDISEELSGRLEQSGVLRTKSYWELIASDFANKARTVTQLNTFDRAEIVRYRYVSVLDQVTSEICRLLNNRVFSVKKAVDRMRKAIALQDPEEIKSASPWVQAGKNSAGESILYFDRGGKRQTVARVDEAGEGEKDKIGTYGNVMSNKQLEAAGVTVPPRHGHCRSDIVTDE